MNKARFKRMLQFIFNPVFLGIKNRTHRLKRKYSVALKKPILKNTVFFEAYLGESVTGNSLALFEEMYNNPKFKDFKFIWSVKNFKNVKLQYRKNKNVKFIIRDSKKFVNYLARSEYLITDTTFPHYFNKRKEQKYIMAWHGTPYKTIGKDIIHTQRNAHRNVMKNILHTDYFISPSTYTTKTILESQDSIELYSGQVIETGMPRVDLSFKIDPVRLKNKMNLPRDKKIVLYAPTWNDFNKNIEVSAMQLVKNTEKLSENLGDNYFVILKVHYLEYDVIKNMHTDCYLVDNLVDTNKILQITDYLVTDYSSIFFDFLPLKKPIFFYFTNYEQYSTKRGLYLSKEELPGEICNSIQILSEKIKQSRGILGNKYLSMVSRFAPYDNGGASERAINYIFFNQRPKVGKIYKTETSKKKLIFYSGYFKKNGITESFIRLTNNFDYSKYSISVIVPCTVPKNSDVEKTLERLHPNINLIFPISRNNLTFFEEYKHKLFINRGLNGIVKKFPPHEMMAQEFHRITGNVKYDKAIDFSGYNAHFGSVIAFGNAKEKIVFLHSDMEKDKGRIVKGKHPNWLPLQLMFSIYHKFDKVISVSKTSHEANMTKLGNKLGISNKMDYVGNFLDAKRIEVLSERFHEIKIENQIFLTSNIDELGSVSQFKGIIKPQRENTNYITLGRLSPEKTTHF